MQRPKQNWSVFWILDTSKFLFLSFQLMASAIFHLTPSDAIWTPYRRHSSVANAIESGDVASLWRGAQYRHATITTLWRRYGDAMISMVKRTMQDQQSLLHMI